jgi:Flp pilus assembly pilin Flp
VTADRTVKLDELKEADMLRSEIAALARRLCGDTSGATAIEYGLVAAGIGGTVAATVWSLGAEVKQSLYDSLSALF